MKRDDSPPPPPADKRQRTALEASSAEVSDDIAAILAATSSDNNNDSNNDEPTSVSPNTAETEDSGATTDADDDAKYMKVPPAKKVSRVGSDYQAMALPEAGSYNKPDEAS